MGNPLLIYRATAMDVLNLNVLLLITKDRIQLILQL